MDIDKQVIKQLPEGVPRACAALNYRKERGQYISEFGQVGPSAAVTTTEYIPSISDYFQSYFDLEFEICQK